MNARTETIEYASMLYDFYGELLSEARKDVMTLYHEDNLSLSEIADELGMSRQAVHYTLKKAEQALEEYESKLGLISQYRDNVARQLRAREISNELLGEEALGQEAKQRLAELIHIIEEIVE